VGKPLETIHYVGPQIEARYVELDQQDRARYERFRDRLRAKLGVEISGDVLDIGCMDGRNTASYADDARSVVGLDIVEHPAWAALERDNLRYVAADAQHLPFPDASFDLVIAMAMLHHAASPTRVLREMIRVRRPGGRLVIVEPNRLNPLSWVHLTLFGDHDHFRTKDFIRFVDRVVPIKEFRQFELHLWPTDDEDLRERLERIEDELDEQPLWRPFILFNVAVA
jgi:ubiquinone/menaquinone biosynthesis C-methylase UbiE